MIDRTSALASISRVENYLEQTLETQSRLYSRGAEDITSIKNSSLRIAAMCDELLQSSFRDKVKDFSNAPYKLSPSEYVKEFKNILTFTAFDPFSTFSSKAVQQCATLCNAYFQVRFNKSYDVNNIHIFSYKSFRDYLICLIISFVEHLNNIEIENFELETRRWLEEVKQGSVKYTLPPSASSIFFKYVKAESIDSQPVMQEVIWKKVQTIWSELWDKGYYKLGELPADSDILPSKDLNWFSSKFILSVPESFLLVSKQTSESFIKSDLTEVIELIHSCDDENFESTSNSAELFNNVVLKYEEETNSTTEDIRDDLYLVWSEYINLTFDFLYEFNCQRIVEAFPELSMLYGSDLHVSSGTIAKAFMFYCHNNIDKLHHLSRRVNLISNINSELLETSSTVEDIKNKLNDITLEESELVEVYTDFVKYYPEVDYE